MVGDVVALELREPVGSNAFASPKSRTFTAPSGTQLDVRGFQIAMDDALLVRRLERFRNLLRNRQRLLDRHGAARQPLRQILALDEFHHEGLDALGVLQPVNGCDVRMIQRGKDFRFALQPRHSFRVSRERLGQDLDGDVAIEPPVARPIHFAHAALSQQRDDFVRAEASSGSKCHRDMQLRWWLF